MGLAVVPVLPYLFDAPVEHASDVIFEWAEHRWHTHVAEKKRMEREAVVLVKEKVD